MSKLFTEITSLRADIAKDTPGKRIGGCTQLPKHAFQKTILQSSIIMPNSNL